MISRRSFLVGASIGTFGAACKRREEPLEFGASAFPAPPAPPPAPLASVSVPTIPAHAPRTMRLERWSLPAEDLPVMPGSGRPLGSSEVAVLIPEGPADARYPLVIALHGRGEARKDPPAGALGWPRDYKLGRAHERLAKPPLIAADFENFVDDAELKRTNAELAAQPFRGVVVVCPYTPDLELGGGEDRPNAADLLAGQRPYGEWLVRQLLPFARKRLPVFASAAATGIDGISLGGHLALRYGFLFPEEFGFVSGLQPAIQSQDAAAWAALAKGALAKNPRLALRILTSSNDYFREAVIAFDGELRRAGVNHVFQNVRGPHDYAFNRGPGALALLRGADTLLARQ